MSQIKKKFIKFGTGSDAVNARDLPANYTPSEYTPAQVASEGNDKVSAHLNGINTRLGAQIDASQIADGSVSDTEFQYLDGVTSDIQTQIDSTNTNVSNLTTTVNGKVTGPASATDNAVMRYDSTTGKLAQNSGVIINDSNLITGVQQIQVAADAIAPLELVTKQQLDASSGGVDVKASVKAATTANITLSAPQTIDGYSAIAGDRILVKNQSTASQNGIYVVAAGSWTRSTDADSSVDLTAALVTVQAGSTQANTGWYQITDAPVIGVDSIVWNQFFGAGTYAADGEGIELTGSTFSLELDGSTLSKSASGLKVATAGISNNEINGSAAIAYSKLNLSASVVNADIAVGANIDASKLGTGAVSTTEFNYLDGVTSSIQTQLNNKKGLQETIVSVASNVTLTAGAVHLVNTGSALNLTLPSAPPTGSFIYIKDITGQANINNITIVRAGSEQIEGVAASYILDMIRMSVKLVSDASGNWWIL